MDSSGPFGSFRLVPRFSNYGEMINHNTANYFVSPNAIGLKSETPHTVGFKIPTTRDFIHCNTAPQKKKRHRKSAFPPL